MAPGCVPAQCSPTSGNGRRPTPSASSAAVHPSLLVPAFHVQLSIRVLRQHRARREGERRHRRAGSVEQQGGRAASGNRGGIGVRVGSGGSGGLAVWPQGRAWRGASEGRRRGAALGRHLRLKLGADVAHLARQVVQRALHARDGRLLAVGGHLRRRRTDQGGGGGKDVWGRGGEVERRSSVRAGRPACAAACRVCPAVCPPSLSPCLTFHTIWYSRGWGMR